MALSLGSGGARPDIVSELRSRGRAAGRGEDTAGGGGRACLVVVASSGRSITPASRPEDGRHLAGLNFTGSMKTEVRALTVSP